MLHAARRLAAAVPFAACLVVGLLAPSPALAQPDVAGTSAEGDPGTEVAIDFSWTQGGDAAAIQLDLTWDPAVLDLGTLSAGDALVDHSLDWSEVDTGRARVTVVTATPSALGDGRLFTVPFTIAADAPVGAWPVAVESLLISSTDADSVDPREVTGGEVIVLASAAAPVEIPTLGTWSLALLTLLLLVVALHAVRGGAPLLVFVAVSLAALSLATPARAAVPAGDANGDGEVDSADIPVIVDQILERGTASGDPDCNGDSSVDVRDTICVATTAPPEPNEAPVLDAIADLGVREREIVGFVATATDPDLPDDELAWSLLEKPVGATIDPSSGSILWVPTGDQVGARSFRVRVTDAAGASDEETFTVDVRALGGPPILEEIADREVVESDALSVTATATDPDLPDDALAFDLTLAPAGMGIDAASGEIAWTPGTVDVGLHDVTVRVTDQEGLIDFTSFVVDVREVNVAPVANNDVFEARLGVPLSVEAPGVLDNDSDANGDVLTSVLDSGPAEGDLVLQPDGSFDYLLEPPDRTTPVELERVCETKTRLGGSNSNIAVGDVDADGVSEIVAAGRSGGTSFIGDVVILNPIDCTIELNTANSDVEAAGGVSTATAVGLLDIDGDGDLEIIGTNGLAVRHLIAFHHDATLAWPGDGLSESSPLLAATPNNTSANHYKEAGPTFADLDGDGTVEIVMAFKDGTRWNRFSGLAVYDASDGSLVWEFLSTFRQGSGHTKPPTVVDLDLDGTMEVIVHNSVVDHNGVLEFELPSTPASGTWTPGDLVLGIANVDDDPFPELFGRDNHARYLFEHDGTLTRKENEKNSSLGQIAVADFDGDGAPEFSFLTCFDCGPGPQFLVVYDTDGSLLWSHEGQADFLHGGFNDADDWNPTAFDANRDGAMDLVIANHLQDTLFIFDGRDGSLLGELDFDIAGLGGPKFTAIADLDQDGDAEIVKRARHGCCFRRYEVWSGTAANPLPAAPTHRNQWIFQEAYNNPDGSIPTNPLPHWLQPGRNGWNLLTPEPDPLIGTTQTFTYHANDGALDSNEATVTLDVLPAGNPPRFLSDPDALTTRGFRYAYAPIVVDPDLGDVVTFHLTAGPDGMTIDPATGAVEWLPDTNGTYPVTILATDTIGFAVDQSWDLVVGDPVTVPDVVGLPQATAESQVTGASLLVGRTSEATHPSIPSGSVSAQTPVGGSVAEFGAEVDLVVSLGPAPEDVDDDGDGFTETGGDCNDNDAAIHPGAPDPPGDGIDQDCDGFDGSEPVAEVVVEPATLDLLAGESRQLKAWAVFADGTAQIATGLSTWQSLNLTTATVTATGRVTAVADTGPAQITATLDAIVGTADVTVTDADSTDDDAPTVEITSPEDGESVFGPVDVLGTADDPNLVRYELLISPAGEESFTQIGGGTSPVVGGVLGELDPTLLLNGLYTLRLAVLDAGGNETMDEVTVQVDGQQKVGHFSVTFEDLNVPGFGFPVVVSRTYDSRDKRIGDFGVGWRLGLRTLEISCTDRLGEGWFVARSGLSYSLLPTKSHRCSVRLPGGAIETFDMVPDPGTSAIVPFSFLSVDFEPLPGTYGELRALDNTNLLIADPQPGEVVLLDDTTLETFAPRRFVYTTGSGTEFTLSIDEGLERLEDLDGNVLMIGPGGIVHSSGASALFQRDAQGRIVAVTDPMGRIQTYSYSASGDLVSHTDREGNVTRLFYDLDHRLLRVEDPLGNRAIRQEFDAQGRRVALIDAQGNRTEFVYDDVARTVTIRDPLGNETTASYDEEGTVESREATVTIDGVPTPVVTTYEYDSEGNETAVVDADGVRVERAFEERDVTELVVDPGGLDLTSTFDYDDQGQLTTTVDETGRTTFLSYNSRRNPVEIDGPGDIDMVFTYGSSGGMGSVTDPTGARNLYEYTAQGQVAVQERLDELGRVISRREMDYDANGNLTAMTEVPVNGDGDPRVTTFTYDANGRLLETNGPGGAGTTREYDDAGNLVRETNAEGGVTEWSWDSRGQLTRIDRPDGSFETFEYDEIGRLIRQTDGAGVVTEFEYDELGRRAVLRRDGTLVERRVYTAAGRLKALVDASGERTEYQLDAAGRVTGVKLPEVTDGTTGLPARPEIVQERDGAGRFTAFVNATGHRTEVDLDPAGRPFRMVQPDGAVRERVLDGAGRVVASIDEMGNETSYEYDGAGRLITVMLPPPAPGEPRPTTRYAWDSLGNLRTETDALGRTTAYAYDDRGLLTRRVLPDGSAQTLSYDGRGLLEQLVDYDGTVIDFEYDARGRLLSRTASTGLVETITYTASGARATETDSRGTTTYSYDSRGRLASITAPDGASIAYTYDGDDRVVRTDANGRIVDYSWDAAGRLASVSSLDGTTTYAYDLEGRPVRTELPNGLIREAVYDSRGFLEELEHRTVGGTVLARYSSTYDPLGRRTSVGELDGSLETYDYDALGRLIGAQRTGASPFDVLYEYDPVGNRTRRVRDGIETLYAYDENDRLVSVGGETFTYDERGHRTSGTVGGTPIAYDWDAFGRLAEVTGPDGTTSFSYDADDRRVGRDGPAGEVRYLLDFRSPSGLDQLVEERSASGDRLAAYTHGLGLVAQDRAGTISFYGRDHHGSARFLSDGGGGITDRYDYFPSGELSTEVGTTPNPYGYSGERYEESALSIDLRRRSYDPATGSFLSPDPFDGVVERPFSRHAYQYADADPIGNVDPLGLFTLPEITVTQVIQNSLKLFKVGFPAAKSYCRAKGATKVVQTVSFFGQVAAGAFSWGLTPGSGKYLDKFAVEIPLRVDANPEERFKEKLVFEVNPDGNFSTGKLKQVEIKLEADFNGEKTRASLSYDGTAWKVGGGLGFSKELPLVEFDVCLVTVATISTAFEAGVGASFARGGGQLTGEVKGDVKISFGGSFNFGNLTYPIFALKGTAGRGAADGPLGGISGNVFGYPLRELFR